MARLPPEIIEHIGSFCNWPTRAALDGGSINDAIDRHTKGMSRRKVVREIFVDEAEWVFPYFSYEARPSYYKDTRAPEKETDIPFHLVYAAYRKRYWYSYNPWENGEAMGFKTYRAMRVDRDWETR